MGVKGIDHWVIVAGDLERTLDFYARLGFAIVWEHREGRPGRGMPTIRINASQKINVHGADWPQRPGYLGARRPTVSGADFCLEWEGTIQEVYFRDPDGNLVEFTVYSGQG
jgi:catechol 2,3-dioxygenase-like lactoylglutathione lyase family enzyme